MVDTTYNAWFRCFRGCEGRYALTDVIYACPTCGGLLEVAHDMEVLKRKPGSYWRELFDKRYMTTKWPYGSSVWGKKGTGLSRGSRRQCGVRCTREVAICFGPSVWGEKLALRICGLSSAVTAIRDRSKIWA